MATLQNSAVSLTGKTIVADRGYRRESVKASVAQRSAVIVLPSSDEASAKLQHGRWMVERCFAWLHQHRALATRYDRKAENYLGMLHLAAALIWLRN